MDAFVPSRRRPGVLRRLRHGARGATPLLAWLAAVCAVLLLLRQRQLPAPVPGLVEARTASVRTPVAGRLLALATSLHASVQAGEVLARLDDTDVRLQLGAAKAELEQLRASVHQRQAELQHELEREAAADRFDRTVELRRLADTAEAARIDRLSTRAALEEARVRLRGTSIEVERLQQLGAQGLVADTDMVRARTEQEALQQRIAELEAVQVSQQQRCDAIAARQQDFAAEAAAGLPEDTVLAPLRWRLQAQENAIERLSAAATQLDLRAPIAGKVASLPHQSGEWLAAGDTVLTVVAAEAEHILAFVPAALYRRFAAAATVRIECCSRPLASYPVRVLSVSPAPVPVPEPLWQVPRQQEWAFEVVLAATGRELPGERVRAQLPP